MKTIECLCLGTINLPRKRSKARHAFLPTWGGTRDKPKNVCVGGYGTIGLIVCFKNIKFLRATIRLQVVGSIPANCWFALSREL